MSQFSQPPPIEDLSDISWQRVERDLFARLDAEQAEVVEERSPRRIARWVGGGVVFAAAAAALLFVLNRGDDGERAAVSRLVTEGAPSSMTVNNAKITAAPHTALLVTETSAGTRVILERGAVDCSIPPQKARAPFVVIAGEVQVSVTGTQFSVARFGDTAEVTVQRGEVTILANGRRYQVGAGSRWPAKAAVTPEVKPEPELHLDEDLRDKTERRGKTRDKTERRDKSPERKPDVEAPTAKERFTAAARLERSDPQAALAIYRQLARERAGVWSANALYAQAELELRRGNRDVAARLLESYIRRYPEGPNAAIARSELARLRR